MRGDLVGRFFCFSMPVGEKISDDILQEYSEAEKAVKDVADSGFTWDDRESLFYHRYKDKRENTKSVYSSGELQGLVIDKSCRIMAQLFSGRFHLDDENDIASIIAANLVFHEHIIPNDRQGGDFLTKERMVNVFSNVYGTMPVFVDWIQTDAYKGPGSVLIHPRRFKPQPGKYVIDDMDRLFVDAFPTIKWLADRVKNFPEIWGEGGKKVLAEYSGGNPSIPNTDSLMMTIEERRALQTKKGLWLVHVFDSNGDWKLIDKVTGITIIDEREWNPGIPIVDKQTIPLLDRYWGLSDYERGETSQKTIDTLIRMYLDSVAISINPPAIMDPEDVVMSSIIRGSSKNWFVKDGKVEGIKFANVSPKGTETFQSTYGIVKGNLLSLGATTDTSVPKSVDPGFGKTPEALKQQANREGARDNWDRYMQERFHERLADKMMAMVVKRGGVGGASIRNISDAIRRIGINFEDKDIAIFANGKVDDNLLKDRTFRYTVDEGSSGKLPGGAEDLLGILKLIEESPDMKESLRNSGKQVDYGEVVKRIAIDKKIPDWDKIVIDSVNPESVPGIGEGGPSAEPMAEQVDPQMEQMMAEIMPQQEAVNEPTI